jgi:hypothetical protein
MMACLIQAIKSLFEWPEWTSIHHFLKSKYNYYYKINLTIIIFKGSRSIFDSISLLQNDKY